MSVVCFVEQDAEGVIVDSSLRAVTFARMLSDQSGEEIVAVALSARARGSGGAGPGSLDGAGRNPAEGSLSEGVGQQGHEVLGAYGVGDVCLLVLPRTVGYAPRALATGLAQLAGAARASAVIAASTDHGNEVMAHLAALSHLPMVANCSEARRVGPTTLQLSRQRWGGSLIEDSVLEAAVALLTVATDEVAPVLAPAASEPAARTFTPELAETDIAVRAIESRDATSGVSLANAKVVVSGGRGIGGAEGFAAVEQLAGLLGGAVGVSRAVTSLGWRPHSEQVGQTGTRVSPDLYIACGISGAIQHLAGCQSAKVMVAINTDPQAPIMGRADYAVIGDVNAILPALVDALSQRSR
ncbi:MAG: electron transfer flavoprotein subunit alpha/FixB family protein [Actinomycetota bacterium]|jgi:electron transfer flavoprotein alpha subunit|nr:electron transfer flavoprotein subunit alpha/FixB family protein [Actinomycetota bacterium]